MNDLVTPTIASRRTDRATGRNLGIRRLAPALILPMLAILVWEVGVLIARPAEWFLPAPHSIAQTLVSEHDRLWFHAQATILTAVVGLVLATLAGIGLAAAISASRAAERGIYPWIVISQTVPVLAVAPMMGIWFGYGVSQIAVVTVFCFFPIVVTGVDSFRRRDLDTVASARSLGASPARIWRDITLPSALPSLFSGLRMASVFAVTGAVVAEYIGADRGLGYLTELSSSQFRTVLTFAAVAWLAVLGVAAFAAISFVERLVLPWRFHPTRRKGAPR